MTTTHTTQHKRTSLVARLAIVAGATLAFTGLSTSPASAQQDPGADKLEICHRTKSTSNPYRLIEVKVSSLDVEGKEDHTDHAGPAFDFAADPAVAYPAPHDGSQWGDIIPPHGDFPGLNWDAGQAIYEDGCQGLDEPADPTCPVEGQVWDDADEDGVIDEGECSVEVTCPTGTTWVDSGDLNGEIEASECVTDACPTDDGFQAPGTTCVQDLCPEAGVQASLPCAEVSGNVVTNTAVTPAPVEVQGVQVAAAELPRTGKASLPLAELGLGLALMGAAAVIFARDEAATA